MADVTDPEWHGLMKQLVVVRREFAKNSLVGLAAKKQEAQAHFEQLCADRRVGGRGKKRRDHQESERECRTASLALERARRNYNMALREPLDLETEQALLLAAVENYLVGGDVAENYCEKLQLRRETNGNLSIRFGGIGATDGLEHGHYVVRPDSYVSYARDPGQPLGKQNVRYTPQLTPTSVPSKL